MSLSGTLSLAKRATHPIRVCQTCLLRQNISRQSIESTRWLHTSRPWSKERERAGSRSSPLTPPRQGTGANRSGPSSGSSKAFIPRHKTRPTPRLSVDSFAPPPPPRETRIARRLLGRIKEWVDSVRTTKKLESYGLEPRVSRGLLREWSRTTSEVLDGLTTDQEAREAMETLGFDHRRLMWGAVDESFTSIIESTFLRHFLQQTITNPDVSSSTRTHINTILQATDLSRLPSQFIYSPARALTRHFHLHIGPTNSGKTYSALKSLSQAKTGAYAGPLRLLAHEVWERMNLGTVGGMEEGQGRECNLLTGEERRIVSPEAGLISCTVEMLPMGSPTGPYDVVVIDEIQMMGDEQRGGSWTSAVLGVQAKEIHLCGDETTVQLLHHLLEPMGDIVTVHKYDRLTPLQVANESLDGDWNNVQPGDCVVTFSRNNIFAVKKQIESTAGRKCAVVYGALPPETRADQARDFNDENGRAEVLVASDAVGMGLNLKINRMIFESLHKFNGKEEVPLSLTQIKQIAGRAGRFGMQRTSTDNDGKDSPDPLLPDETPAPGGTVTTLHASDLPILKSLLPLPLPPITRAIIDIPSPTLSSLAALLAPETTFAELLEHASTLAVLPAHTTLGGNRHRVQLADIIEPLRDQLTMKEMETFTFAPVQYRDQRQVAIFQSIVLAFAQQGRVDLIALYDGSGLMESLEVVEATIETLPPRSSTDGLAGNEKGQKVFVPQIMITSIPSLETLHKSLVMYIWLSFRYDVSLPDRALAVEIKERVEKVLDECLARLPGMRKPDKKRRSQTAAADTKRLDLPGLRRAEEERLRKEEAKKIQYVGKGQEQARKRKDIWKHVGLVEETETETGTEGVKAGPSGER